MIYWAEATGVPYANGKGNEWHVIYTYQLVRKCHPLVSDFHTKHHNKYSTNNIHHLAVFINNIKLHFDIRRNSSKN